MASSVLLKSLRRRLIERLSFFEEASNSSRVYLVDVRTVPRSLHQPQFNKTSLPQSSKKAGLGYVHMRGLDGLRHATRDSIKTGWRNASFRGYADYM
jgi:Protein of unknown function, DUF488.